MIFGTKRLAHLSVVTSMLAYALGVTGCGSSAETTDPIDAPASASTGGDPAPGGGSSSSSSGAPSTPAAQPEQAPKIVSTLPADGAKGVKSDSKVVIKFDHAMDVDSVIAAYASAELPADKVSFGWSAGSDELTITPSAPLAYAKGDLQVAANGYSITIAKTAKDGQGLALADDFSLSFSTLRHVTGTAPHVPSLSGYVLSNGLKGTATSVGDFKSGGIERQAKAFLTFDLAGIPEGAEVQKAILLIEENTIAGTPDASLGALALHHVIFSEVDMSAFDATSFVGAPVTRFYPLNANEWHRKSDITALVADDLTNRASRADRSQVRFAYPTAISGNGENDFVSLDVKTTNLTLEYLVP